MNKWRVNLLRFVSLVFAASAVLIAINCAPVQKKKSAAKVLHACNATDVKVAINPHNRKFKKQMDECASNAMGDADSTTKCLKKVYPALSSGCASCFGDMAECSAKHCAGSCIFNHFSEGCLECAVKYCRRPQPNGSFSLVTCTGISGKQLPPK